MSTEFGPEVNRKRDFVVSYAGDSQSFTKSSLRSGVRLHIGSAACLDKSTKGIRKPDLCNTESTRLVPRDHARHVLRQPLRPSQQLLQMRELRMRSRVLRK